MAALDTYHRDIAAGLARVVARAHPMDRLATWRNPVAKPLGLWPGHESNPLDHAMHLAGFGEGYTMSTAEMVAVLLPGRLVTKVDWRGCMATERREEGTGRVLGLSRYGKNGYTNWRNPRGTLGVDIDYGKGPNWCTWTDFSRMRFVGRWPYHLEEWS